MYEGLGVSCERVVLCACCVVRVLCCARVVLCACRVVRVLCCARAASSTQLIMLRILAVYLAVVAGIFSLTLCIVRLNARNSRKNRYCFFPYT